MENRSCTFFGHRDTPNGIRPQLKAALVDLIENQGVTQFYVGNQGCFDSMAIGVLSELIEKYPIRFFVVLAGLPEREDPYADRIPTIFPEGLETVPRRFAIDRRNRWMIEQSDSVVTYVRHPYGGAAKIRELARRKGRQLIEI